MTGHKPSAEETAALVSAAQIIHACVHMAHTGGGHTQLLINGGDDFVIVASIRPAAVAALKALFAATGTTPEVVTDLSEAAPDPDSARTPEEDPPQG